jgi:hypothetical protein
MSDPISRRSFSSLTAGAVVGSTAAGSTNLPAAEDQPTERCTEKLSSSNL